MGIKRAFDLIFASILLILLSPIFLVIIILLRIKIGKNVFFVQKRVGMNLKTFNMIKFRTMSDEKDENGNLLPDIERITKVGQVLRALSLDELPEIINIIKGDMSFIGPRPLLPQYIPLYNETQIRRHEMLPGLTGWAQVNGRNNLTWRKKFEFDVWYVDNWSIKLDIKILFLTIYKVIKRDGINQNENNTMEYFNGEN